MRYILMVPPGASAHFLATVLDILLSGKSRNKYVGDLGDCHDAFWEKSAQNTLVPFCPQNGTQHRKFIDLNENHFIFFHANTHMFDNANNVEYLQNYKHLYVWVDEESRMQCATMFFHKRVVPMYNEDEHTRNSIVGMFFENPMPVDINDLSSSDIEHFINGFSEEYRKRYFKPSANITNISYKDIMKDPVTSLVEIFNLDVPEINIQVARDFAQHYNDKQTQYSINR